MVHLDAPSEWTELSASQRSLVPNGMRKAFEEGGAFFARAAAETTQKAFARWLLACSERQPQLQLYDTEDFGRLALLRVWPEGPTLPTLLDFRSPSTRVNHHPPSSGLADRPEHVPEALAEVHATVGAIQHQLGGSGSLIPPDALKPLRKTWPDLPRTNPFNLDVWLSECPGKPSGDRLAKMFPFYEDSGDYLCFEPDGRAMWIGYESGGVMPFGTVARALDAYFECILTHCRPTSSFVPTG